jgi:hypothetical protein
VTFPWLCATFRFSSPGKEEAVSDAKHASVVVEPLEPWALSPKQTAIVENCGLSVVYERLANGEYDAFKDGTRTKITVASIRQRRASLPLATFKPFTPRAKRRRDNDTTTTTAT